MPRRRHSRQHFALIINKVQANDSQCSRRRALCDDSRFRCRLSAESDPDEDARIRCFHSSHSCHRLGIIVRLFSQARHHRRKASDDERHDPETELRTTRNYRDQMN